MAPRNPWKRVPVHRIMVFCEHGMTDQLVSRFMTNFSREGNKTLLDPFVGSGTVIVEGLKVAETCIGIDSNPWALVIVKSKVSKPKLDIRSLDEALENLEEFDPLIPSSRLEKYYSSETLELFGRLRAVVEELNDPLSLVIFAKIAEKYSKLRRSPAPKFREVERKVEKMRVVDEFRRALIEAIKDVETYSKHFKGSCDLFLADSSVWLPRKFDGILTSPPFANNVDYIRHTQLQLLWAGIAKGSKDLGRLRSLQIPACEAAARCWKPKIEDERIVRIVSSIDSKRKYSSFLLQYFHAMKKHFELVADGLGWEGWYTVGDSYFANSYIPTHKILKRIADDAGLTTSVELLGARAAKRRRLFLLTVKP